MSVSKTILTGPSIYRRNTDVYFVGNNKKIICKKCNNWSRAEDTLQTNRVKLEKDSNI